MQIKSDNSVVVVAAHPDDEVLGCGATIARLAKSGRPVHVLLMADGESARLDNLEHTSKHLLEDRKNRALLAGKVLGVKSVEQMSMPDNRMDQLDLLDVVKAVEKFVIKHHPLTLFTHHSGDVNIDHRVVHDAVIAACRPQPGHSVRELLFFETPSSTEWRPPGSAPMFNPNWFVDVSDTLDLKLQALDTYKNELREFPHARSIEAITALARWRGTMIGVAAAEAFILGRKFS